MATPDEEHYELVLPFLPVTSRGGPFDDAAFAAGWQMAALDAALKYDPGAACSVILSENVEQADLIAMRNGFGTSLGEDVGGYTRVTFERISTPG